MRTRIQTGDIEDRNINPANLAIATDGLGNFALLGIMTGTMVILDESSMLGSASRLNFIGAGVLSYISGTTAYIEISAGGGAGGGQIGVYGIDDGLPLGTGTWIDFGDYLDGSISGTTLRLDAVIPADPVQQIGVYGLDEGQPLGTGTWLDVGRNLDFSISGSVLRLDGTTPPPAEDQIGIYALAGGVPLGTGTWLDIGNQIAASISGTVIAINTHAPFAGVDQIGVFVRDEGADQATGTILNFVGDQVSVSISGTVATVIVGDPAGGTGTTVVYDDDSLVGSFSEMRYIGDGVEVFNSGTYAAISIPGDGGASMNIGNQDEVLADDQRAQIDVPYPCNLHTLVATELSDLTGTAILTVNYYGTITGSAPLWSEDVSITGSPYRVRTGLDRDLDTGGVLRLQSSGTATNLYRVMVAARVNRLIE